MVLHMLDTIDQRREAVAQATPNKRKSELGQFMTPSGIADFMAGMFRPLKGKKIRLLDAGAGIGSLTAAFVQRAADDRAKAIECEVWEIDPNLHPHLSETLDACSQHMAAVGGSLRGVVKSEDFIIAFSDLFSSEKLTNFTHAILNPPYKKIRSDSPHRAALRGYGVETANLYSAFVSLAIKGLRDGGELVAITPRSFCNGTYFRPFRELILQTCSLEKIHLFDSRTDAFRGDEVLQENVIFHLVRGKKQGKVSITSSSDSSFSDLAERKVSISEITLSEDKNSVFHLVPEEDDHGTTAAMSRYNQSLEDLGLTVSTGPVVDFRLRNSLRPERTPGSVPLVYVHHFQQGYVVHPRPEAKKPNWIEVNDETKKWLVPGGTYVLVRRLSSKEERRRIVPALIESESVPGEEIGLENHLNFFHTAKRGIDPRVARGLAVYLGSTFADQWLRRFSGHTQVNAGDLRLMRYPELATLKEWGGKVGKQLPSQEEIDNMVDIKQ